MKRLIIMRHAKSDWDNPGIADIDRPLNQRGQRGAAALGQWMKSRGFQPDVALVSSATRTRETWDLVESALDHPNNVNMLASLYEAEPGEMLTAVQALGSDPETVLLVGHNPGIAEFARNLLNGPSPSPEFTHYSTGATTVLGFEIQDWADLRADSGRLLDFVTPRALIE